MAGSWRIRGYELDRRIGAGASSEVWRAIATSSGDVVALKRLTLSGADQARRAVAEAAKLRVLDHPHLVRLHDLVLQRDSAVLVLDLADAGSLADLLTIRGRLTPGEAITAIAPVAAALAHVHAAGIVHGDVSPANILFTPGGVPLLADLGVSRLTGDVADAESTPAYVDPLVARGGVPTPQTDVFMLGAVALHALTGAPLWTASTGDAALALACTGGLGHVEGRLAVADLPPAMSAVLRRALTLDPARRGTAADFALDLRHSAAPVAVELAAGRARAACPPAAARAPETPAMPRPPEASATPHGPEAPAMPRPSEADVVPAAPTLTRPRRAGAGPSASGVPQPAGGAGPSPIVPAAAAITGSASPAARPQAVVPPPVVRLEPVQPAGARSPGTGGRHAATPVVRMRRPGQKASTADRARSLIAAHARRAAGGAAYPAGPAIPDSSAQQDDPVRPPGRPGRAGLMDPGRAFPDAARPVFARPPAIVTGEVVVGRPAPTSAVARARPTLPGSTRRVSPRLLAAAGTGVLVVLVAVALGLVLWRAGGTTTSAGARPAATSTAATGTGVPRPAAPAVTSARSARPTAPQADPDWGAALRRLDDTRARAFATRDTALLDDVYVPGPLRLADAASMTRLVPRGCGLRGIHTEFSAVQRHVAARSGVVLTARAVLPRSRLVCSGRVVRTASAVGPTRLQITLVHRGGTTLIAAERKVR